MACHAPWNREFIDTTFPRAWVCGEYMKFREGVLFEYEKSQLPSSQHLVRNYRTYEALERQLKDERVEAEHLRQRLRQIEINKWNIRNRVHRIQNSRFQSDGVGGGAGEDGDPERRTFVRACPVDDCRGFLSTQLRCGTCETYACAECFGVVGTQRTAPHECHPDDVASAKLIKKESKPCPKCGINITKIDGCDQMFCTKCRTAFSWRTGAIVTGTIHNPHYFEMLRNESLNGEIPRQPGDTGPNGEEECPGEFTDPGRLTLPLSRKLAERINPNAYQDIMRIHRHACHLHRDTIPIVQRQPTDTIDLRLAYLLGSLNEATFRRKLVLREKTREKAQALADCYNAKVQLHVDAVMAYMRGTIDEKYLHTRLSKIHDMMRPYLQSIAKRFNCTVEFGYRPATDITFDPPPKKQRTH